MPYKIEKTADCPVSKPWGVINAQTGSVNGRCHSTREEALSQQRAIMASEARKHSESYMIPITQQFAEVVAESDTVWIQAAPYATWTHPMYGDVEFTPERAQRMKDNFDQQVYGQDVTTDYEHTLDRAKGSKSSGTITALDVRDDGLYVAVKFTETARKEIKDGEWRYFSPEWYDTWTHPVNNQTFNDVFVGGGLTNKPWIKGILPLNFSEAIVALETQQFAVWSTAYINTLPDSSFLYIESGGKKDSEGKTTPRSLRHLPYKDKNGNVDLPHLRNALARIPQSSLSSDLKGRLTSKAQSILNKVRGGKKMSETEVKDENAPVEHQDTPADDTGDLNLEEGETALGDTKEGGSRVDSPPTAKEPENKKEGEEDMPDLSKELKASLGLPEDASDSDLKAEIDKMHKEVEPLRAAAKDAQEKVAFSEKFPEEAKRLAHLEKKDQENAAKAFSEAYARFTKKDGDKEVKSTVGLPQVVLDEIESVHKKFSERTATAADLQSVLDLIAQHGLVDYAEKGSSRWTEEAARSDDPAKAFSECVAEVEKEDKLSYDDAVMEAAKKYPEEFAAYREKVERR